MRPIGTEQWVRTVELLFAVQGWNTSVRDALSYSRVSKSRELVIPVRMVPRDASLRDNSSGGRGRGREVEIK